VLVAVVSALWIYYPREYIRSYLASVPETVSLGNKASLAGVNVGAAVRDMNQLNDSRYLQLYNSVTPENALKLGRVMTDLDTQTYDFEEADALVNHALAMGLNVRGHALVFGKASDMFKSPDLDAWLEQYPETQRSAMLTQLMRQHISVMLQHYRGRIHTWDVVNEVLDLFGNGNIEKNVFQRYVGEDYIEIALRTAKEADETIKIVLNEQLNNYTDNRAEAFFELIKSLVERGVPLDGVGLQAHNLYSLTPPHTLKAYMKRFAALGLSVEITELEARLKLFSNFDDPYLAQGKFYRDITQQCLDVKACLGVTFWGYSDETSWMNELPYLFPVPNEPYLLDINRKVKPAVSLIESLFDSNR
jgi:Beta-1,4-xylanase